MQAIVYRLLKSHAIPMKSLDLTIIPDPLSISYLKNAEKENCEPFDYSPPL